MKKIIFFIFATLFLACSKDSLSSSAASSFKVLSLNTFLLDTPDIVNGPSCEEDCVVRAQKICDVVSDSLKNSPDLILLQEVFESDACTFLKECLTEQGYIYSTPCLESDPDWMNSCFFQSSKSSGLMIFSKIQFAEYSFESFVACNGCVTNGSDCQANKGFQYCNVTISGKGRLHILNTHFDAGESDEDIATRSEQLAQMKQYVDQSEISELENTIIAGDFNSISKYEIDNLENILGLESSNDLIATNVNGSVLDHILYSGGQTLTLDNFTLTGRCDVVCENWFNSDHLGLVATLNVDCL